MYILQGATNRGAKETSPLHSTETVESSNGWVFITDETNDLILEEFEINVLQTLLLPEQELKQLKDQTEKDSVSRDPNTQKKMGSQKNKSEASLTIALYTVGIVEMKQLAANDEVLFKDKRVIVPKSLPLQMLSIINSLCIGV